MKHLTAWFKNASLNKKYLFIISGSLLLISSVSLAVLHNVILQSNEMLYRTLSVNLVSSVSQVENGLEQIETLSELIRTNSALQNELQTLLSPASQLEYTSAYRSVYDLLQSYQYAAPYVKGIAVVQDGNVILTSGYHNLSQVLRSAEFEQTRGEMKQAADNARGAAVWYTHSGENAFAANTRDILKIGNLELCDLGQLYIQLDVEGLLLASTGELRSSQNANVFLFYAGRQLAGSTELTSEQMQPLQDLGSPYAIVTLDGEKKFAVSRTLGTTQWQYVCYLDYDNVFRALIAGNRAVVAILICTAGLCIGISGVLVGNINRHFTVLIQKMDYFQRNQFDLMPVAYDYSSRRDELGKIHQSFDGMAKTIRNLVRENYVKQMLLQEQQIQVLRQQLNPHFLYNTLDTINWHARASGSRNISVMVESLANMMRTTLTEKRDVVSLQEECALLQNYLNILNIRFEDRLTIQLEIDHTLDDCTVPSFCLQPLVENAVKYALEDIGTRCIVRVCARRDGAQLTLKVQNTGSLFEDHLLEKLYRSSAKPGGTGIGLCNLDTRVRLLFGAEYGLILTNQDGMATVCVTLPCSTSEKGECLHENDFGG